MKRIKNSKWLITGLLMLSVHQNIAQKPLVINNTLTFDYHFSGGTPVTVQNTSAGNYNITPITKSSGSQFFYVCFKIDNFLKGQEININLNWPSVLTASNFAAGTNAGVVQRQTQFGNFASVVPQILFYSYDKKHWLRLSKKAMSDSTTIKFSLKGQGRPLHFATQIPFTLENNNELLAYVAKREPQALKNIGNTQQGHPMYAVALEAKNKRADTIFIQALQHGNEFTGGWVVDAMIRYLLNDREGKKLRERFAFQFITAFHTDFLQYNLNPALQAANKSLLKNSNKTENPNRDLIKKSWPEVNNVDRFITENVNKGTKYVMGFDLHNGWGSKEESGGYYLAFTKKQAPEAYVAKQFAFNDFMIKNTDHITYREPLTPGVEGLFFEYFYEKTKALSMFIEFSRYEWWNREMKAYTPYNQYSHKIYAMQALNAITQFEAYYNTIKNTV